MFGLQSITHWFEAQQTEVIAPPAFQIGDEVGLYTQAHGCVIGKIERFCDNPYYGQTGEVAYIVSRPGHPFWTEYLPVERLEAPRTDNGCGDCDGSFRSDQLCPECGNCLATCCECPPEFQATEEPEFSELSWWGQREIIEGQRADDEYENQRDSA